MAFSGFRAKLLAAMLGLVIGVTGSTLFVTQQGAEQDSRRRFEEIFDLHRELYSSRQLWVKGALEEQLLVLVRKQRIQLALLESDVPILYEQVRNELVVRGLLPQPGEAGSDEQVSHFVFLDAKGDPLLPAAGSGGDPAALAPRPATISMLHRIGTLVAASRQAANAYLALPEGDGKLRLHQAVFSPVTDNATGEHLGAFGLLSRVQQLAGGSPDRARGAVFFEGAIYSEEIDEKDRAELAAIVGSGIERGRSVDDDLVIELGTASYRVLFEALEQSRGVSQAWLVVLIPMADAIAAERELRRRVLALGAAGLVLSVLLSAWMSRSLTRPIADLVRGTLEIREGAFDYRVAIHSQDEIGQLGSAFNDMAAGLAQREKLRRILDMVADKEVAQELVAGNVLLGGETRDVSVLFCDIRGFTTLSEGMSPPEVIRMLNEHFSPLTRLVYEHHGVVDKFVGDLIMAVFGAPRGRDDDALNACRCALAMVRARRELNERSVPPIDVGIGVATGLAVAGCVGTEERQNYTVLGARINLASRLCGMADRMQVVIDAATREKVAGTLEARPLGSMELKGFVQPIEVFALDDPQGGAAA